MDDPKQQLIDRLNKNLSDYHAHLLGFGKQEIIDMAARAAAMADVHMYLTGQYAFNDGESEYLLNFQNPLEVVTDAWEVRIADLSDLDFIMRGVCDQQDAIQDYPLMSDASAHEESKKPSIMEQLKAAKQTAQSENKPKTSGASKDKPR